MVALGSLTKRESMSSSLVLILACLHYIRAEDAATILDSELSCQGWRNSKLKQPGILMTLELPYRSWTTLHVWEKQCFLFEPLFFFFLSYSAKFDHVLCSVTLVVSNSLHPMECSHQAPLSVGFSRQEYWSGFPCLPPVDLPDSGIESMSHASPALQADSLLLSHWGSPKTWS